MRGVFSILGFVAQLGTIERDLKEIGPAIVAPACEMLHDEIKNVLGSSGELERLHAALDGNLRHRDWIDRLAVAADEALEAERRAMRDLIDTKPSTMAGATALLQHLATTIL